RRNGGANRQARLLRDRRRLHLRRRHARHGHMLRRGRQNAWPHDQVTVAGVLVFRRRMTARKKNPSMAMALALCVDGTAAGPSDLAQRGEHAQRAHRTRAPAASSTPAPRPTEPAPASSTPAAPAEPVPAETAPPPPPPPPPAEAPTPAPA